MNKIFLSVVFLFLFFFSAHSAFAARPGTATSSALFPQIINPYNLPEIFGSLINVPNNIQLAGQNTFRGLPQGIGMDLFMYIIFSVVYIMFMHFAVGIKNEFSIFWMIGYFLLGGIIGGWLHTYEGGFVFSIIISFLFF